MQISISGVLLLVLTNSIKADYVISHFQTNWPSAVEYCTSIGKRLVITNSKQSLDAVVRKIMQSGIYNHDSTTNIWIAANDLAKEGEFRWHGTGQKVSFINWGHGNPDNAENIEHCVTLLNAPKANWNWQANDQNCNDKRFFVCEDYNGS